MQGALRDYTDAIAHSKNYGAAYLNRGLIKGQTKDYKGAIEDFTQALRINPNYPAAYYNRGLAYFYSKDSNSACMDWTQALRMGAPDAQKAVDTYCKNFKK
jgi:tetratricopeptide (TPR) repeat protein